MSNKLNPFEEQLRKAANSHEVPYDANQWAKLEKQLDQRKPSGSSFGKWSIAAIAAMVVAVTLFQLFRSEDTRTNSPKIAATEIPVTTIEQENIITEIPVKVPEVNTEITSQEINLSKEPVAEQKVEPLPKPIKMEKESAITSKPNKKETAKKSITKNIPSETKPSFITPKIVLEKSTVCSGVEFVVTLSEYNGEEIIWDLGNGETVKSSVKGQLNYTYHEKGDYQIKALFPKYNRYSESVNLFVNPRPDASFEPKENLERGMVPVVYFASNTGGELVYSWNLGDGTTLTGEGVSHTYRRPGDYEISLRVVNKHGCSWTNYRRYTQDKEFNLLAPSSFSPNGDGVNDMWFPVALSSGYFTYQLSVYDRNSKLIFESTDSQQQFDGRVDGTLAPSGEIFIWKATTVDNNNVRQEYGGTIISMY